MADPVSPDLASPDLASLDLASLDLASLWACTAATSLKPAHVNATMATMVPQSYVNHVPTMTGGVGHDALKRFYKYHFIGVNPADFRLTPVSRTIGTSSLVDEFIASFTHTSELDWLLPGIAPTGRKVEIPMLAVVTFEEDKLASERIYWDQASVLVQVGLLDPAGLPVAGAETAQKVLDSKRPSNILMSRWKESEGKPL